MSELGVLEETNLRLRNLISNPRARWFVPELEGIPSNELLDRSTELARELLPNCFRMDAQTLLNKMPLILFALLSRPDDWELHRDFGAVGAWLATGTFYYDLEKEFDDGVFTEEADVLSDGFSHVLHVNACRDQLGYVTLAAALLKKLLNGRDPYP